MGRKLESTDETIQPRRWDSLSQGLACNCCVVFFFLKKKEEIGIIKPCPIHAFSRQASWKNGTPLSFPQTSNVSQQQLTSSSSFEMVCSLLWRPDHTHDAEKPQWDCDFSNRGLIVFRLLCINNNGSFLFRIEGLSIHLNFSLKILFFRSKRKRWIKY